MKIAMIGHKRIPSREGGVEIVVEALATRMAERGNVVHAYNRGGHHVAGKENDAKKVKNYKNVKIITVPTFSNKKLNAIVYSGLATLRALFGKYDVIHYHAEGPCSMIWLPHLFGIRTVATIHGLDWQRSKWGGFATKFLIHGEKTAAKYADEIIVLSKSVQEYFNKTYKRETHYIPNGVDLPQKREVNIIRKKYSLEKDSYILFLARLVPEKGLHYLLEAFKEIDTDKKLIVAGGTSHSDEYVEKIKRAAANDERVILTGFVQGEELEELYSNCFLYVLPSNVEGMPISLLEAMSYGCACLTSDIDENTQLTGEFGYKFRKSDTADLKSELERLLKNGIDIDRNLMIENIKKNYGWDGIVDETLKLYKRGKS
jgi:glycosyltransferase involved in cell wall biosynthesis